MSVYLTLQKNYGDRGARYAKTIAVQRCGQKPYELTLRFAGCCLHCGACFAAGYSWQESFRQHYRVRQDITVQQVVADFHDIPHPPGGRYNWLRVLGGEPLLNDEYVAFLFDVLLRLSQTDSDKFNHGIIIQTNGVHTGKGNTALLRARLAELHAANPRVVVAIETSLKGTNHEEFALLSQSDESLFRYNVDSYYRLRELQMPNLRPTCIAGYGISESFLLSEGTGAKSMISVLFDEDTPTYHPSLWSSEFAQLYSDFTSDWSTFDPIFSRMPMYGIKDEFNYAWATNAIKRGKGTYGWRWYDAKYAPDRKPTVEAKFQDIIDKFFLRSNQEYYSTLISHPGTI